MDRMITEKLISAICAISFIATPVDHYKKDPDRQALKIIGTGFLVRPTIVITNRHVIEALNEVQAKVGIKDDELYAYFCHPMPQGIREL